MGLKKKSTWKTLARSNRNPCPIAILEFVLDVLGEHAVTRFMAITWTRNHRLLKITKLAGF